VWSEERARGVPRFIYKKVGKAMQKDGMPVLIYFDDIGIGGKTIRQHMERGIVFRHLEEHRIALNASKARLAMSEIKCLESVVGRYSVESETKLRAFLGLLNLRYDSTPSGYRTTS
jgi:hypothetical protein